MPDEAWPPAPTGWTFWTWVADQPGPPQAAAPSQPGPDPPSGSSAAATGGPSPVVGQHSRAALPPPDPRSRLDAPAASVPTAPAPASWRARHAAQKEAAHWQIEQTQLDRLAAAAQGAVSGGGGMHGGLLLAPAESVVWTGQAALIEPQRQQGHYVGGSTGVSLRVATGVRWRVGGMRGHYVPGPELQTPVDQGSVALTTARVVFTGGRATREWSFDKLLGVDATPDGRVALLHVSNRQKVSGLELGTDGADFQDFLALAIAVHEHGPQSVAEECLSAAAEHRRRTGSEPAPQRTQD